ncbi:DMT family transporter [Oceanibium sediminis]|uniref:DMT family transporter n=1 Tax=Oceanibium sediminis TaxID=2026339 RepID=UPI000DD35DB6|nr:DMT family transporter [Oceanibium sediminis]
MTISPDGPGGAPPPEGILPPLTDRVLLGIGLMIAFALLAPGIDIFAKLATQTASPGEVALARFAVQAAALWPMIWLIRRPCRMTRRQLWLHALRGALMGAATLCFITAVSVMPVADAIAIFFVEPLILTLLSAWLLGEVVGPRRVLACALGFVGALIVVRPSFQDIGWVAVLPLVTALAFAFYLILTRQARAEDPLVMQGIAGLFGVAFLGIGLLTGPTLGLAVLTPVGANGLALVYMAMVGVMATISHLFLVYAFRFAPAATLAPLQYLEIIAATAFGYWVFGDFPDAIKWAGIAIIVASGLFVFWREQLAAQRAR